jgi:two-component system, NtrC family, response regulator HydG
MTTSRILVVDDNRSLVEALSDVFEAKGYDVTQAFDGAQAVEKVRGASFDCILMDIRMPNLSGVDAFKEIKKVSPGTPVILMTAYSVQGLIDEALADGVLAVLNKPLAIDKVLKIIQSLAGSSSVLIVDQSPNSSLVNLIGAEGYKVMTVPSASQAISMIATREYDAVLLNADIPGLTSEDSLVLMKECDPKCIIILMSSEDDASTNSLAYACLQKPFKIKQVLELLERVRTNKRLT